MSKERNATPSTTTAGRLYAYNPLMVYRGNYSEIIMANAMGFPRATMSSSVIQTIKKKRRRNWLLLTAIMHCPCNPVGKPFVSKQKYEYKNAIGL